MPIDTIQGAALATLMKQDGCTKIAIVNDKEVYGQGLAKNIELAAKDQGVDVVMDDGIDKKAPNYRSLARRPRPPARTASCSRGITANNARPGDEGLRRRARPGRQAIRPGRRLRDRLGQSEGGRHPRRRSTAHQVHGRHAAAGQVPRVRPAVLRRLQAEVRQGQPDPYAIYGYEAMSLALDAIKRSGTGDKADVLKALFATKDRQSVLGTYSIDQNGDTTLTDYGAYKVRTGRSPSIRPSSRGSSKVALTDVNLGRGRLAPPPAGRS